MRGRCRPKRAGSKSCCGSECRGRGLISNSDEHELEAQINFPTYLAALFVPELRSQRSLPCLFKPNAGEIAQLPQSFLLNMDLFSKQRIPKLNAKKWRKLCLRRALHVLVVALSYAHNGLKMAPLAQKAVFKRLQALLIACEKPGSFPLPAGRSGFEFIAGLIELEPQTRPSSLITGAFQSISSRSHSWPDLAG